MAIWINWIRYSGLVLLYIPRFSGVSIGARISSTTRAICYTCPYNIGNIHHLVSVSALLAILLVKLHLLLALLHRFNRLDIVYLLQLLATQKHFLFMARSFIFGHTH